MKALDIDVAATVTAAQRGDRRALTELVTTYLPLVYNVVGRAVDTPADVDDIVQDTMLRAVRDLPALRSPASFPTWLAAIAVRQVGTYRHRRQTSAARTAALDAAVGRPDPGAQVEGVSLLETELSTQRREIAEASRWLDPDDRVLLSFWWQEVAGLMSRGEIAAALDIGVAHAGVRLQRMREQLDLARAVVAALSARPSCPQLAGLVSDWNGRPNKLWRKRLARHVRACPICSSAAQDRIPVERLLAGLPAIVVPAGFTELILSHAVTLGGPAAATAAGAAGATAAAGAKTIAGAAAAAGASTGAAAGASAGAAGTSAGAAAGTSAGTVAGTSASASAGASAGATVGTSAGASASATVGASAGATAGAKTIAAAAVGAKAVALKALAAHPIVAAMAAATVATAVVVPLMQERRPEPPVSITAPAATPGPPRYSPAPQGPAASAGSAAPQRSTESQGSASPSSARPSSGAPASGSPASGAPALITAGRVSLEWAGGGYLTARDDDIATVAGADSPEDRRNATFIAVTGLADPACFSFQTPDGRYLRHYELLAYAHDPNDTATFRQDATYCPAPGVTADAVMLRSHNYPEFFLRWTGSELRIGYFTDSAEFRTDSSFRIRPALT